MSKPYYNTKFLPEPGILTWSGRRVSLVCPTVGDIDLDDIKHHLARIGRYTGAGERMISVAQHCVHVSHLCPPELAVPALLHDAPEAYLGDVSSPLKSLLRGLEDLPAEALTVLEGALDARTLDVLRELLPGYRHLTRHFEAVIATRFGFDVRLFGAVKQWDLSSMLTERRDNGPWGCSDSDWTGIDPYDLPALDTRTVYPWTPSEAESRFAARAAELGLS